MFDRGNSVQKMEVRSRREIRMPKKLEGFMVPTYIVKIAKREKNEAETPQQKYDNDSINEGKC